MTQLQEVIIDVKNLYKSFGHVEVLKDISMQIHKCESVCIIGPSGSGKSTLIRCLNALNDINSGTVKVFNQDITKKGFDNLQLRKNVGMVFQQYNLFPHKTAIQNVSMAPIKVLHKKPEEALKTASDLLEKVKLSDKKDNFPLELSGGQQQRVAIARALAMGPKIMLFDEVTAALDPEMVKEVLLTIKGLIKEGMTCVLVTHEMGFAREVADTVYFMAEGKIVEKGTPQELFNNPQDPRTIQFLEQVL